MAESAALLVDEVFPEQPVRQCVQGRVDGPVTTLRILEHLECIRKTPVFGNDRVSSPTAVWVVLQLWRISRSRVGSR